MSAVRRHLASLGLTVVLCHVVMQVLVPAALCCHQAAAQRAAAPDCCGKSHPGQVCPMHRAARGGQQSAKDCSAQSQRDFLDLFIVLNSGGIAPAPVVLTVAITSESAFLFAEPPAVSVFQVPPGPPPRA